jgi:hypothetical protein
MRQALLMLLLLATDETGAKDSRSERMERVRVAPDGKSFVLSPSGKRFVPVGFNYDHDESGRLIEDYWDAEWIRIEEDFAEMKTLGASVVRIHLQFGKFMTSPTTANEAALERLQSLLELARKQGLYLDLTGLGCYHKRDVPAWYDALSDTDRWEAQANFWSAIAARCKGHPAVFCYDLMNEPVVPGGKDRRDDWLGPAFGDKYFVQFVTLHPPADGDRPAVAKQWIARLSAAIRAQDQDGLITVGLVDWSLDRPGLTSGFVPARIADELDFLCVHCYPESGKVEEAVATVAGFNVGKPVLIEETFPLKCHGADFDQFLDKTKPHAAGVIGFYWGRTPDECRKSSQIVDKIILGWYDAFERHRTWKQP